MLMKNLIFFVGALFAASHLCFAQGPSQVTLTGDQLNACSVALAHFKQTETNADLSHYTVKITPGTTNTALLFIPEGLPAGLRGGGATKYGVPVDYLVSTKDGKIVRKSYMR